MIKIFALVISGLLLYFVVDYSLEYRYWKIEQKRGVSFIRGVIDDVHKRDRNELAQELTAMRIFFDDGKNFDLTHDNIEKLAKMFILSDALTPQSQNYYEFRSKYIKAGTGLAPGCHYDFLILLYEKEMGLPKLEPSDFCQGWNELDKEFDFWGQTPHGRSALRY